MALLQYLLIFSMVCGPRGQSVSVSTGFPEPDAMSGAHLAPKSMCHKHEIKSGHLIEPGDIYAP